MDRRKGALLNNILQTITSCIFLLLASILIYDRWHNNNNESSLLAMKKEIQDANIKNIAYLEGRVNRVAEISDSYQANVNSRISVIEIRMDGVEKRNSGSSRIINNNSAYANGQPVRPVTKQEQ